MKKSFDVAIIGAGVAGCFSALRIAEKHKNISSIMIDLGSSFGKRRRQIEGSLGCFPSSDGKIYPSDIDAISKIVDGRKIRFASSWVDNILNEVNNIKLIKDNLPSISMQKKLNQNNFITILNNYYQWKPVDIHKLSKILSDNIENAKNVKFSFDNEVYKIIKNKNNFNIFTQNGEILCKKLILCVGRSGWRWATKLYKDLGITINNNIVKYGVKIEMSSQYLKELNNSHCSLIRPDLEIGPFNWKGTIIPEDHSDLVISNFRSNEDRWKSDKVSFSFLSCSDTSNDGVAFMDRIAKLVFLLFNDRISKEKIKVYMKGNSQLNLLPEYDWLKKSLIEVNSIIPDLISRGSLYAPDIIPMASQISLMNNLETDISGLYVAGESAGIPGIYGAMISGTICADSSCKEV